MRRAKGNPMRLRVSWKDLDILLRSLLGIFFLIAGISMLFLLLKTKFVETRAIIGVTFLILLALSISLITLSYHGFLRWIFPNYIEIYEDSLRRVIYVLWKFNLTEWELKREDIDRGLIKSLLLGRDRSIKAFALYLIDKNEKEYPVALELHKIDLPRALAEYLALLIDLKTYSDKGVLLIDPKKVAPPFLAKLQMISAEPPKVEEVLETLKANWKDKLKYKISPSNLEIELDVLEKSISDKIAELIIILFLGNLIFLPPIVFSNAFRSKLKALLILEGSILVLSLPFLIGSILVKYKLTLTPEELVVKCYRLLFPNCTRTLRWEDILRFFGTDSGEETRIVTLDESGTISENIVLRYIGRSDLEKLFESYVYYQTLR